jgi:4-amino-4-deoxy-L-arabinose transferase-like glycosyltransferase
MAKLSAIRAGGRALAGRPTIVIAALAGLAVVLRLPFAWAGISMDEGGYAYVATRWASGARLYSDAAWVDRPQGLLVLYRAILAFGDTTQAVRVGAAVVAGVACLGVGIIARQLAGVAAGIVAAAVYAVASIAPAAEGFTLNGELGAAAFSVTSLAIVTTWWRRGGSGWWLLLAGLAGGAAITVKQSGFDGLVMALGVAAVAGAPGARRRVGRVGVVAAGGLVPLGLSAGHGVLVGWHRYWWSVLGYRLNAPSGGGASLEARWRALQVGWHTVRWDIGLLAIGATVGVLCAVAAGRRATALLGVAWTATAFVGVNVGGLYWPHYFVQLIAPLCVCASFVVALPRPRAVAVATAALACAPVIATAAQWSTLTPNGLEDAIPYYRRSSVDEQLTNAIRACGQQQVIVLPSEADLYFLADRPAPYPYLWGRGVAEIPGAIGLLRSVMLGPHPPPLVAWYRDGMSTIDPGGAIQRELRSKYHLVRQFSGVRLMARGPTTAQCRGRGNS